MKKTLLTYPILVMHMTAMAQVYLTISPPDAPTHVDSDLLFMYLRMVLVLFFATFSLFLHHASVPGYQKTSPRFTSLAYPYS